MLFRVKDVRYPIDHYNVLAYFAEGYSIKFRFANDIRRLQEIPCGDAVTLEITIKQLDNLFEKLYDDNDRHYLQR